MDEIANITMHAWHGHTGAVSKRTQQVSTLQASAPEKMFFQLHFAWLHNMLFFNIFPQVTQCHSRQITKASLTSRWAHPSCHGNAAFQTKAKTPFPPEKRDKIF